MVPAHGPAGTAIYDIRIESAIWSLHRVMCHAAQPTIIFVWISPSAGPPVSISTISLLRLQMGSLAVSASWGLLLYVCTRFSWAHYDTGKQEVCACTCASMACTSPCSTVLACTQLHWVDDITASTYHHACSLSVRQAILLGALAFVMAFIVLSFCSSVSQHHHVATLLLLRYMRWQFKLPSNCT